MQCHGYNKSRNTQQSFSNQAALSSKGARHSKVHKSHTLKTEEGELMKWLLLKGTTQLLRTGSLAKSANTWCKDTVDSAEDLLQKSHAPSSLSICLQAERILSNGPSWLTKFVWCWQTLPISVSAFAKDDTIPVIWNQGTGQVACPLWCPTIQHAFTAEDNYSWVPSSYGCGEVKRSPYPTFNSFTKCLPSAFAPVCSLP